MSLPDDQPDLNPTGFNDDFGNPSPREWAEMYRAAGLQVVPCKDKRPDLARWADLQNTLVSDATFARWYRTGSEHGNMGMITGPCSGNVLVLDLDIHKHVSAAVWWQGLIETEASGIEPETVEQITGGGGEQKLFRAPAGYRIPTNRTGIGVDIRGQAGFAVLPPTLHQSGKEYAWKPLRGPWEIPIAIAPQWLLDAIEALVGEHGGHQVDGVRTASPEADYDAFGNVQDGREVVMRDCVWRAVLERYREAPIKPPDAASMIMAKEAYEGYERKVTSRIPSVPLRDGLEQEGRGATAFYGKWRATMRHWGSDRMKVEAARPNPRGANSPQLDPQAFEKAAQGYDPSSLFERLSVPQIKSLPDPKWLVSGLIIEHALGFIYGPPGCLKTFMALDLGLTFATGRPAWWGREVEHGGAVIYISSEGQGDLKFRIRAWEQHRKTSADASPFRLIRQSINFLKVEDVGKLLATVQAIADETAQPIAAVFVDTVSRVLPGSDENLQKDMTVFIAACDAVRQKFGATVIGIHHTSRAGNMRGSTVIPAAGDFIIEMRREPGAPTGSIFASKIKASDDGWEQFFRVEKVTLGDVGGHVSLVVDGIDAKPADDSGWPERDICRQILAAIDEEWEGGKPWCFSKNSPRCAVKIIAARWVLKSSVVERLLVQWVANKIIAEDNRDAKNHIKGYRKLLEI